MKNVLMNRLELLAILEKNLQTHKAEYAEALVGYREKLREVTKINKRIRRELDDLIENEGDTFPTQFNAKRNELKGFPTAPVEYSEQYTMAIRMIELDVRQDIELDSATFNQLVLDQWGWKSQFTATNSAYIGTKFGK